jgi:7-cyano-7-deazaguanine synthase
MTLKAIVLLSGGLDSTTTLAIAKDQGYQAITLSFDYGQRHRVELDRARDIARRMGAAEHRVLNVDLAAIGHSALTADILVPTGRCEAEMASAIPVTYVPARNTIFLAYALAVAEVTGARDVFVGVNAVDYSGYPDCRPEYIAAFETLANLATRAGVEGETPIKIHAPLIDMSKADIIRLGLELGVDYSLTHSCYQPDAGGLACGVCDSCRLRLKGFQDAGAEDPLTYQKRG